MAPDRNITRGCPRAVGRSMPRTVAFVVCSAALGSCSALSGLGSSDRIRVKSARCQCIPVPRQRDLQDALLGRCSREERQLQRNVHPGGLHSANCPGPHQRRKRALVLFRGGRDQSEPGHGNAQIGECFSSIARTIARGPVWSAAGRRSRAEVAYRLSIRYSPATSHIFAGRLHAPDQIAHMPPQAWPMLNQQ